MNCLTNPAEYILVDISLDALKKGSNLIALNYPNIGVKAISADYNMIEIVEHLNVSGRKAIVFLSSTIGNMEPDEASAFLAACRDPLSGGESLTVGADLKKDVLTLERAYNDSAGITLNLT